ncbi:MAG: T9SS type A sorting domain-containing protein [Flavicella sp.]
MKKITKSIFSFAILVMMALSLKAQEDVAVGPFQSTLNTSSSGQTDVFETPTASISDTNFPIAAPSRYANIFSTASTYVPRLDMKLIDQGEGYKFKVSSAYNTFYLSEITYTLNNVRDDKGNDENGNAAASVWVFQGSNDDTNWEDLCDPITMDSPDKHTNPVTLALDYTNKYRWYRFVLAEKWEPTQTFTALTEINFKVASKEDVAIGDFSDFNTSASNQTSILKTPVAAIDNANFTNTSYWSNIYSTENSVARLAQKIIPAGEGYKFEVELGYHGFVASKITYKIANAASHKGVGSNSSQWIVQGSNDNANWDNLCDPIVMVSANTNTEVSENLTTSQPYRYYQFVLKYDWEPNDKYTALQEVKFTVGDQTLSVPGLGATNTVEVYPNPASSVVNINGASSLISVQLFDVTGALVFSAGAVSSIDVSSFVSGIYLMKFKSADGTIVTKKVLIN